MPDVDGESDTSQQRTPNPERLVHLLRRRAMKAIYHPRPAPAQFPAEERLRSFHAAIAEAIGADEPVSFLEFGVYRGRSIRRMAELFTNPDARFVGFDCFVGLPERWAKLEAGHFSTNGAPPQIDDTRVSFVTGYFQNTFSDFIAGFENKPPVLVHFDADLYSSTLFLLTSLWHYIPEYYFIFDEFPLDEATAMYDFTSAFPVHYEFLACTTREKALVPMQVFGRLTRAPFEV